MLFKFIWKYLKPYSILFGIGLVTVFITSGLLLIGPSYAGQIVDKVIKNGHTELLVPFLLIMAGATLLRSVLRYLFQLDFETVSQRVIFNARQDIYNNFQTFDSEYFDKTRTGDIMTRLTGDIDAVRHFVAWVIYMIIENSLVFILGLAYMFYINATVSLLVVVCTLPTAYLATKLTTAVKPSFKKIRTQFSKLNTVVEENISGNRVVKAFAKEDYEIKKFDKVNLKYKKTNLESAKVWSKFLPPIEFFSGSLGILILLFGGYFVIKGKMTMGELVTFNSLTWMVNNPLRMSGWLVNDCQRVSASVEKIVEILDVKPTIVNAPNAVKNDKISGNIEFKNVSFKYGDEYALQNINLKVNAGDTIGIVGPTGSGKTTLMNLLYRFYDCTSGEILIDGVNIKNIDLNSLRKNIGTTMQDVFLFSDTIEGNIAYGVPTATLEDVKFAATLADADGFIKELEEGYDTIIGERGVGLSGGQKQRISLARALIKKPSILILDDTTSAVDMETEYSIQSALKKYNNNRTTFVIAHRISSVKNATKIIVLNEGKIIEAGTHNELIAKKNYYYDVYMNQVGNYDEVQSEVIVNG